MGKQGTKRASTRRLRLERRRDVDQSKPQVDPPEGDLAASFRVGRGIAHAAPPCPKCKGKMNLTLGGDGHFAYKCRRAPRCGGWRLVIYERSDTSRLLAAQRRRAEIAKPLFEISWPAVRTGTADHSSTVDVLIWDELMRYTHFRADGEIHSLPRQPIWDAAGNATCTRCLRASRIPWTNRDYHR